jgi:hypothetical protein
MYISEGMVLPTLVANTCSRGWPRYSKATALAEFGELGDELFIVFEIKAIDDRLEARFLG